LVPVGVAETPDAMVAWSELIGENTKDGRVPALVGLAAASLDLLCIHPFRDGNGRVSRLMVLDGLYDAGFEAGRYVSLERLIETSKARYYETLEQSSVGWHEGDHDPWPYVNYILYSVTKLYEQFEERLGEVQAPRGSKTELVEAAVESMEGSFRLSSIADACPSVSVDMVRTVLRNMREEGRVSCEGRGKNATWKRT